MQNKATHTAVVILGAGLSRRFGAPDKLMADLDGRPVAGHVIGALAPISFAARFAVIVPDSEEKSALFAKSGYEVIYNTMPDAGLTRSRNLALRAARDAGLPRAALCLADMPFITGDHIQALVNVEDGGGAVFSRWQGTQGKPAFGPPALFGATAMDAILKASDQMPHSQSRPIQDLDLGPVTYVQMSTHSARDIDTAEDLRRGRGL